MSGTDSDILRRHPFFRAMVTMGGAITLGCGGVTNTGSSRQGEPGGGDGGHPPDGAGGASSTGAGGAFSAQGGSSSGSGGRALIGAGGSVFVGSGGRIVVANGGSAGQPEPVPVPCAPAQWRCESDDICLGSSGFSDPGPCSCDPGAPLRLGDCAAGQSRICRKLAVPTDTPIDAGLSDRFDCHCIPTPPDSVDCNAACESVFTRWADTRFYCQDETQARGRDILCGCALIVLK